MAFEFLPAIKAAVAALSADEELMAVCTGGVHLNLAPQGTPYPLILISVSAQTDVYGNGATRVLSMPLLLVKILTEGTSPAPVQAALDRMDDLLSDLCVQVDDFYLHGVTRAPAGAIVYLESLADSSQILHLGAMYRAHLSKL